MRFLETVTAIALISLAMTACADEGHAIANDLTELRQQLGSQFQASEQGFQQAVQDVAKRDQVREKERFRDPPASNNWPTQSQVQPPINGFSTPEGHHVRHPRHSHHHRRPQPTPATRLRETAFQLDRLAHELEMAELYEGADTLRDTAEKLRKSARQSQPQGSIQGGPNHQPVLTPNHRH